MRQTPPSDRQLLTALDTLGGHARMAELAAVVARTTGRSQRTAEHLVNTSPVIATLTRGRYVAVGAADRWRH